MLVTDGLQNAHTLQLWLEYDQDTQKYISPRIVVAGYVSPSVTVEIGGAPANNLQPYTNSPPAETFLNMDADTLSIEIGAEQLQSVSAAPWGVDGYLMPTTEPNYPTVPQITAPSKTTDWDVLLDNDKTSRVIQPAGDSAHQRLDIPLPPMEDTEYRAYATRSLICATRIDSIIFTDYTTGRPVTDTGFYGSNGLQPIDGVSWLYRAFPTWDWRFKVVSDDGITTYAKPYELLGSPYTGTKFVSLHETGDEFQPPGGEDGGLLATRAPDDRILGFVEGLMLIGQLQPGHDDGEIPPEPFVMLLCLVIAVIAALIMILAGGGFERGIHPARIFLAALMFTFIWSACGPLNYGVPVTLAVPPLLIPIAAAILIAQR